MEAISGKGQEPKEEIDQIENSEHVPAENQCLLSLSSLSLHSSNSFPFSPTHWTNVSAHRDRVSVQFVTVTAILVKKGGTDGSSDQIQSNEMVLSSTNLYTVVLCCTMLYLLCILKDLNMNTLMPKRRFPSQFGSSGRSRWCHPKHEELKRDLRRRTLEKGEDGVSFVCFETERHVDATRFHTLVPL